MQKNVAKNRGRKAIGDAPMTAAERQRKRRETIKKAGGRMFLMEVDAYSLKWIECESEMTRRPVTEILKEVLGLSLQRYGEVVERMTELAHIGASPETIEAFVKVHAFPNVPTLRELVQIEGAVVNPNQQEGK